MLEYLWKTAWCFFVPGCQEAEAWVGERALQILRGKASDVAAGMRRSATLRDLCQVERKGVDTCADYLVKYREMLRYDRYLAEGFLVATGVIEGACRHLVKDRMDITGARWRLRNAVAETPVASLQRPYRRLLSVPQSSRAEAQPPFTDGEPRLSKGRATRLNVVLKEPHPFERVACHP